MKRIEKLTGQGKYREYLEKTARLEAGRKYCKHGMPHLLDVARIAYILDIEENKQCKKDVVYAAALLHDIGRFRQYEDGTPHEEESARLAGELLAKAGFGQQEVALIEDAIRGHRDDGSKNAGGLRGILYRADKLSRACFCCPAEADCSRSADRKNMEISY